MVPVLPVKFDAWMRGIPTAFISMMAIKYVSSTVLSEYPMLSNLAVIAGGFFIFTFCILYSWDFVIPKLEFW